MNVCGVHAVADVATSASANASIRSSSSSSHDVDRGEGTCL